MYGSAGVNGEGRVGKTDEEYCSARAGRREMVCIEL
jgi:hypothetical protein